jgi:hypothetical protein
MRRFASNYLSGRVKTTPLSELTADRYDYIGLDQVEPNFGLPISPLNGSDCFLMTTGGTGARFFVGLGDDLALEDAGNNQLKIGISGEATSTITQTSINASSLQLTSNVGATTDRPLQITSTQGITETEVTSGNFVPGETYRITVYGSDGDTNWDSIDETNQANKSYAVGTLFKAGPGQVGSVGSPPGKAVLQPALDVAGGGKFHKSINILTGGLQLQNSTSIDLIAGDITGATGVTGSYDGSIKDNWSSNAQTYESGIEFRPGNIDITNQAPTTDSNTRALVVCRTANVVNNSTQVNTLIFGKNEDNELDDNGVQPVIPSYTEFKTNQHLKLMPAQVSAATDNDPAVPGTVFIEGNLVVNGTQTTVNSTDLSISDKTIVLANGARNATETDGAGIIFGDTTAVGAYWTDATVPAIKYDADSSTGAAATDGQFTVNRVIEATGFSVPGGTNGQIVTIGGTIDNNFSTTDTIFTLGADTSGGNAGDPGLLTLTPSSGSADTVEFYGNNGIEITSTPEVTTQGSEANAKITIDGSQVTGTTYDVVAENYSGLSGAVNFGVQGTQGTTTLSSVAMPFVGAGNIDISYDATDAAVGSAPAITFKDTNSPSYSAADASLTVNNTKLDFDPGIICSLQASHKSANVLKAKRVNSRTALGGASDDAIVEIEMTRDVGDNALGTQKWLSFRNVGTGRVNYGGNSDYEQGSIAAVQPDSSTITGTYATKDWSGIRVWGRNNIHFDVFDWSTLSNAGVEQGPVWHLDHRQRKLSITEGNVILSNSTNIESKGTNYNTTLAFPDAATADITLTLPDQTSTLATIDDLAGAAGGELHTEDGGTVDAERFVVFAATGVSADNTTQDPLTSTALRYNTSTNSLTVGGDVTVSGTLTATTKSFLIDHPTKDNMKLQYGSLEGPENGVYVRGRLSDNNVIELPDYWTGLVDESTVTVNLTPIGSHQQLYVEDIIDNTVVVGSNDTINCFYTVFAERNDVEKLVVEYEDV